MKRFTWILTGAAMLAAGSLVLAQASSAPAAPASASAASVEEKAQTVVHMLDYVSVDYPEFVHDGKVVNPGEYEEQKEFATQSITLIGQLPEAAEKAAVLVNARELLAKIEAKAPGTEVSALANAVRADVIRIYKLAVAPRQAPDLAKAKVLFAAQCVMCHGVEGRGDGPLAKGMEPQPSDFHEEARMKVRSIYGLYNTVSLGVGGTPMRGFTEISEADRWALAFFVSDLRTKPEKVARGETLWNQGTGKTEFASLRAFVTAAPGETAAKGADLDAVRTYLTRNPSAIQAAAPAPLDFTRAKLDEAIAALKAGNRDAARQAAITAYLEGFELVEASLDNVDAALRTGIENEMMAIRAIISDGKSVDAAETQVEKIKALLDRADEKLGAGSLSPTTAFISSLLILLREGLEAILVLAAISAFVKKTGRRDAMPYVHAGWIGAVVLGVLTWAVASYFITISGANRELTEGVTALLAAGMLLYVGYWLHSKSYAQAWNTFIREQVSAALGKRTLWAMAGVSFLAVYRELFEIILFYQTLWVQAGPEAHHAVLGGIAAAAVLLAIIGGAILKYSVRLPIGPFFSVTSWLLSLMAVVFVGNGVAALQEAGFIESMAVPFVKIPLLGIYPTAQGLGAQAIVIALIVVGVMVGRAKAEEAAQGEQRV